ncbi:MAG: hypothetical protein D6702_07365 [Planctomycetota bacterium]|nr:MAG: hypothetical protein D6702_07365 [Planctomycetota bacterium]
MRHTACLLVLVFFLLPACREGRHESSHFPGEVPYSFPEPDLSHIGPPEMEMFPCSDCHDPETADPERRQLEMAHEDIVLEHDEEHRWCLDCHDLENRDMLHLASGELIPFEKSYRLCGQCHGDKYRDWKAGVHGRRTGHWDDPEQQQYLLCANCHSPHSPAFKPIQPKPVPHAPEVTK